MWVSRLPMDPAVENQDLIEKLCSAELEVEKVAMMTTGLDQSAISEDDVKTAEGWVNLCAENS